MDKFIDYFNAAKKEFKYTVKLARNNIAESELGKLEQTLQKYSLKSMSAAKKTPIQLEPIDFPNVRSSEVYITEVVLEYPVTPDALLREISEGVEICQNAVAVYAENDPRHQYIDEWNERMVDNEKFFDDYEPKLGSPEKWETEPDYGDKYNTPFLASLADSKKEEIVVTNDLVPEQKTDTETVAGEETSSVNNDAVLNDRFRNKSGQNEKAGSKNTLMSTPAKEA